ncbi:MAG: DUF1501 domain-containing protein [Pirellula sp.]|nr:DUF1501 domain-containing protein [Pirellula sp.]
MPHVSFHDRSRREFLRLGGLALPWAWGMSSFARSVEAATTAAAKQPPGFGKAKSVILVYCDGGQSQLEMWDPKPDAPAEVRGDFRAIATSVPGTFFGEHQPRIAKLADQFTVVRSMSHADLDHGSATYLSLTGKYHKKISGNPPPLPTDEPTLGAVLRAVRPNGRFPYDAAHLNGPLLQPEIPSAGQQAGFLGPAFEPLVLGNVADGTIPIPELTAQADLPPMRMQERQSLKRALDGYVADLASAPETRKSGTEYEQALTLLDTPQSRAAFDLRSEPATLRERYGVNQSGQALLLSRRLVEAGLPLVTVFWSPSSRGQDKLPDSTDAYGWDTHNDIFSSLKNHLLPRFDQGFSALLEDLEARGLMESTLVVCLGEFGRAPLVALEKNFAGSTPGRKHWANVYSIVMAGAGVSAGKIVGASDRQGGRPEGRRYGPWDTIATIYSALGIDPAGHYRDLLGRPIPLSTGRPIEALYHD